MASSSSSSLSRTCRHRVFASFQGNDVRKTYLSHLRKQFDSKGITLFDDQRMERSQTIPLALTRAIKESKISIVVLSKNYASSSWCLNELVEILECKKNLGQIVMTVFYGVDPSDVRKQTGDFGKVFKKTCARKTDEDRRRWSKALTDVGNIAGEHLLNWDNEAKMIEKIAKDVLDKLNVTRSRDFDGMVGLDTHLREMHSLLDLDYDGVKMAAITGPAEIGKTTIARALHSLLSNRFQFSCFVDNLRESCHSGFDEHGLKLRLQEQFLSKVLNHNGMRICHLGAIKENLCDQKVLIILDDVNNLKQLEALAGDISWFGPGSRIVVTTENKELLQQHGINNTYHVGFPSTEQALKILCRFAFTQSYPHDGFKELAERVTELCGNLPLGLRVVGSLLRGKEEDEWEDVVNRLETVIDRDIEDVLKVSYDSLDENEQTLFLLIAVFFNNEYGDLVKSMFADGNLDVKRGLKILVNRSLIYITDVIVMHKLLRQMARQAIHKQEPWKRQVLMDGNVICDILENERGTSVVSGISFDVLGINEVIVSERAFKRMPNLRFLRVCKTRYDGNDRMHIPEGMEFPRRLRLLHWEAYPNKCLPPTFHPEYLVELNMQDSKLEYLWQGTQPLTNLKKLDLLCCYHLKELPDLSDATNLEELNLSFCESLVEIPYSFLYLQKLETLLMVNCINLQDTPSELNLSSLCFLNAEGCSEWRNFSMVSPNLRYVDLSDTFFEDLPLSISLCSFLEFLTVRKSGELTERKSGKLKRITHLPTSLVELDLSYSDIERIPDCIKGLYWLKHLYLFGCRRLVSLPELPGSLKHLTADDCESLEIVFSPLNHSPYVKLNFINCFKLGEQARQAIIQSSFFLEQALLPGREVPTKFEHRARGNSLTIPLDGNNPLSGFSRFKLCVVVSPNHQIIESDLIYLDFLCRRIGNCDLDLVDKEYYYLGTASGYLAEHICIFDSGLAFLDHSKVLKVSREIVLEFSCESQGLDIIECGAHVWTDKTIKRRYGCGDFIWDTGVDRVFEDLYDSLTNGSSEFGHIKAVEDDGGHTTGVIRDEILEGKEHTDCWSWLLLCFDLSCFVSNIRSLVSGRRQ